MLVILVYLLSCLFCIVSARLIKNDDKKVIDIVHTICPSFQSRCGLEAYLSDIMIIVQLILTILTIHIEGIYEMLFLMSITQVLRAFCAMSTVLPPLQQYNDKWRFGGLNGGGTEYIFSGHASYSALTSIYLYNNNVVSLFSLALYNIISQGLIVVTRNHYTVDVLLAWIIVPLLYGNKDFICKYSW